MTRRHSAATCFHPGFRLLCESFASTLVRLHLDIPGVSDIGFGSLVLLSRLQVRRVMRGLHVACRVCVPADDRPLAGLQAGSDAETRWKWSDRRRRSGGVCRRPLPE